MSNYIKFYFPEKFYKILFQFKIVFQFKLLSLSKQDNSQFTYVKPCKTDDAKKLLVKG